MAKLDGRKARAEFNNDANESLERRKQDGADMRQAAIDAERDLQARKKYRQARARL